MAGVLNGESDDLMAVIGEPYCGTRVIGVSRLPKTERVSKLWLDVEAALTVVPVPSHLTDDEDLEAHYEVMLLENDDDQDFEVVEFADKIEIDLGLDDSIALKTLTQALSDSINVPSGDLSSAASTILNAARRESKGFKGGAVCVHLEASITIDVVDVEEPEGHVDPAFVPASKSSIERLERVRVEASLSVGSNCSICIGDIAVGSEAIRMPCLHLYHEECIVEWLEKSRVCPMCRFSMPT